MDHISLKTVAEATGGEIKSGGPDIRFQEIVTDSRVDCEGALFVPLTGETFDGHAFISTAASRGAVATLASRDVSQNGLPEAFGILSVMDTLEAYQNIARANRRRYSIPVIGITGSCGKTTTKNIMNNVLSKHRIVCTRKNENNEIGVPHTLIRMDSETEFAIVEMGMRARHEIARLAAVAEPTHVIITNVEKTHIGRLGSEEEIARAKAESIESLGSECAAFLNADNKWTPMLRGMTSAKVTTFGIEAGDVKALDIKYRLDGSSFRISAGDVAFSVDIQSPGKAGVYNAVSVTAAALSLGLGIEEIQKGLALPVEEDGRMRKFTAGGVTVLDDSYNSNPASLRLAIELIGAVDWKGRKTAVLGDMLELGEHSGEEHFSIGRDFAAKHFDVVITLGEEAEKIAEGAALSGLIEKKNIMAFKTYEELAASCSDVFHQGDLVLVKGSRGMKMERVVKFLGEMGN